MQCNIKEYLFEEMQQITGLEVITPEQMMDYIYGVLNSPCYVEKFNDLLKQNYLSNTFKDFNGYKIENKSKQEQKTSAIYGSSNESDQYGYKNHKITYGIENMKKVCTYASKQKCTKYRAETKY